MTPQQRFLTILAHAWQHSAFYRQIYTAHGIRERDLPFVQLEDLPVVFKADLMERFDDAVTDPRLRKQPLETWVQQDTNPLSLYLDEYIVLHSSGGAAIYSYIPYTLSAWRFITATVAPRLLPLDQHTPAPMRSAFYFGPEGHFASTTNASLASRSAHQVLHVSLGDPVEEVWARLNAFHLD
jgi:phenylacetate-CoA ligase